MANGKILDAILNTINEVQRQNKANPNEVTADPNVFDLIKGKLRQLDEKNRAKRVAKGKSPISIMDMIKKEIEGARRENKKDPNVETAPKSVFDQILKKVESRPKRQASQGIRRIAEEYNLDVSRIPQNVLQQVQAKYMNDRKNFDQQYAKAIHDLTKQFK